MSSLSNVLKLNAISSGATGILLTLFPNVAARVFGVTTTTPFIETGLFLTVFAVFVFMVSRGRPLKQKVVTAIVLLDTLWVIGSAVVILLLKDSISFWGSLIIAGVALWVALMAYLQYRTSKNGVLFKRATYGMATIVLFLFTIQAASAQTHLSNTSYTAHSTPKDANALLVATQFLQAVKEKSHAKAAPLMDSLIQWSQPGNNRFSGEKKNAAEVFAMFGGFIKHTDGSLFLADVQLLAINENSVACSLRWKAVTREGNKLDVQNIDVYTIENGKIVKAVVYSADLAQEDAFWGN